jgi:hypothetical protein
VTGDFQRVLQPGTYTITCAAPGYDSTTIAGLVVDADATTVANCALNKACAAGAPTEVLNQRFVSSTTVGWDPPANGGPAPTFDIARGALGEWPVGTGASEVCEQPEVAANEIALTQVPDGGTGYWYLIRAATRVGSAPTEQRATGPRAT